MTTPTFLETENINHFARPCHNSFTDLTFLDKYAFAIYLFLYLEFHDEFATTTNQLCYSKYVDEFLMTIGPILS